MKCLYVFSAFLLVTSASLSARNPIPLVYQLSPTSTQPGHAAFTLQVRGTGFVPGATVRWNGQGLATTYVSGSLVQASVPASNVSTRSTASVSVANQGTIASNSIYFPVHSSSPSVTLAASPIGIEQGLVTVADLNNDSIPDIAVYGSGFYLDTYFGNGKGSFTRVQGPRSQGFLSWACTPNVAADFNNDGFLDLALCSAVSGGSVTELYGGAGTGAYKPAGNRGKAGGAGVAADMNGDGNLDYVSVFYDGQSQPELEVLLGDGTGTLTRVTDIPYFGGQLPVVGDFNGDGKLDIALIGGDTVSVFLGNGDGTLQAQVDYRITGDSGATSAVVADVNGDGNLHIVTNGVGVLLGAGDGTFTNTFSMSLGSGPVGNLSVGDFNADGKLDLATTSIVGASNHQILNVIVGNGDGTYQAPSTFDLYPHNGEIQATLGAADFNNDGKLDFVIGGSPTILFVYQK